MPLVLIFLLIIGSGKVTGCDKQRKLDILLVSTPFQGHIRPIMNLGEELSIRGHNVTLVSIAWANNEKVVKEKGMRFISAGSFSLSSEEIDQVYHGSIAFEPGAFEKMLFIQINPLANYVNNSNLTQWDIVIADDFSSNAIACIAKKQSARVISITPRGPLPSWLTLPLWTTPLMLFPGYPEQMNFMQRLIVNVMTTAYSLGTSVHHGWTLFYPPSIREESRSLVYMAVADGHEYPILVLSVIGLEYSQPITPLTHFIGPIYPKQKEGKNATMLPLDLREWLSLQTSKQCTILISMGSMVTVTPSFADKIIQSINNTNYSAIWTLKKYKNVLKDIQYNPDNFYISDWIPQFDVLRHEAIAGAILHGGTGGINDAFYNAVPIICMPFGGDQKHNCFRVQELGAGIMLDHRETNVDTIRESIETICTDEAYQRNAQRIRKTFSAAGGLDEAVKLIELYSIVGYDHLIPSYVKYNWNFVQYHNIDVQVTIGLITVAMGITLSYCMKKCSKMFSGY